MVICVMVEFVVSKCFFGLGVKLCDFEWFVCMDLIIQGCIICDGMDVIIVECVVRELLQIFLQILFFGLGLFSFIILCKIFCKEWFFGFEFDCIVCVFYICEQVVDVFEDEDLVVQWMCCGNVVLGGLILLEVFDIQLGYDWVCDILVCIVFGVVV